ncbi:MAG: nucleotide exchange factor GrpE [Pyrinomonadaceae bacterium]|nr:nucleotide exchange factor GrpE [Pyrinomonadaceae bacterium]
MNRQENEKRKEDFKLFLKNSALFTTSAANFLKNYQYDKWFDKLKRTNYLSNFMSWFNKKTMNEQDYNDEEIIEGETEEVFLTDKQVTDEPKNASVKSPEVAKLENDLRDERVRREAAEAKLVGVQAKFDELKTQMERETAEMRQRLMKTLEDRAKQGQFNFLTTLLPVLDNLNLGIKASETDASFEHLLSGVKGTARSFEQALTNVGVEPIAADGAAFDPELHEAVEMIETGAENDGKIVVEFSRGYKFGDKLLRPARVQVGKAISKSVGE